MMIVTKKRNNFHFFLFLRNNSEQKVKYHDVIKIVMVAIITSYHVQNKHSNKYTTYVNIPKCYWSDVKKLTPFFSRTAMTIVFTENKEPNRVVLSIMTFDGGVIEKRIAIPRPNETRKTKKEFVQVSYLVLNQSMPSKASYYVRIPRDFYLYAKGANLVPLFDSEKPIIVFVTPEVAEKIVRGELYVFVEIEFDETNHVLQASPQII